MILEHDAIEQLLNHQQKILQQKEGRFFFVEEREGISVDKKKSPHDKSTWSPFRRLCFNYVRDEFQKLQRQALVLDVGMGQSQFREVYQAHNVIGADFHPYDDVRVICDFTQSLPFQDETFDVVLSSNVLEHLQNPEFAMREYARVLKKKGRLILVVPFLAGPHQIPHDYSRYTQYMLELLVKNAGLFLRRFEILGTAFDAYTHIQTKMFTLLRDTKDTYPDFFRKVIVWGAVQTIWLLQHVLNVILRPFASAVGVSVKLPSGYGFTAEKI